jgi:hypothetical protein
VVDSSPSPVDSITLVVGNKDFDAFFFDFLEGSFDVTL